MRKVYWYENVVAFCSAEERRKAGNDSLEEAWLVIELDSLGEEVQNALRVTKLRQIFETAKSLAFVVPTDEMAEQLFGIFARQFVLVDAAGGVVTAPKGEVLMIYRNGRWDLPKGKVEPGELLAEAAVREVEEECGVEGLKLGKQVDATYHMYELEGQWMLKRTSWFAMKHDGKGSLTPQEEEGITDIRWVPVETLEDYAQDTYQTIRDVLERVFRLEFDF